MKLKRIGQGFLAATASLAMGLGTTSCNPSTTIDYIFVTSNSPSGQITSYHVDSQSGALTEVNGTPVSSQGNNPVYEVTSPNAQYLYVANHDSNNIAVFSIATSGQLASLHTYTTPGSEPISLAVNAAGTLLFVVDYYAPGFSDTTPGPGALVVYPINSDGTLGAAVTTPAGLSYSSLQCFPTGVAISPNGSYVYVTNTNSVIVTTASPTTATPPATPAGCPSQGTISGYSVAGNGTLTAVAGSPFTAGSTPTGIAIDQTSRFLYTTDSAQNQLIVYDILSGGALFPLPNGPFTTGTFPVAVTVDPRDLYIYVTNFNSSSISEFTMSQGTGAPSALSSSNFASGSAGPTCIVVDPGLARFVYTSDYVGSYIGAGELNPNTGELTGVQNSPYPASGKPTCVTAVPHGNHATQYVTASPNP
jgi:6-phosphogluconolactonase